MLPYAGGLACRVVLLGLHGGREVEGRWVGLQHMFMVVETSGVEEKASVFHPGKLRVHGYG